MRTETTNESNSKMLMIASTLVIAAGAIMFAVDAAAQSLVTNYSWILFAAMTLLVAPIDRFYNSRLKSPVRFGLVCAFACAALFGPSAGVVAAVINVSIVEFKRAKTYNSFFYIVAVSIISISEASLATSKLFPEFGSRVSEMSKADVALAMGVFMLCYFGISTSLAAVYSALSAERSFVDTLKSSFHSVSLCYISTGACAIAIYLIAEIIGNSAFLVLAVITVAAFFFLQALLRKTNNSARTAGLSNMLNPVPGLD